MGTRAVRVDGREQAVGPGESFMFVFERVPALDGGNINTIAAGVGGGGVRAGDQHHGTSLSRPRVGRVAGRTRIERGALPEAIRS